MAVVVQEERCQVVICRHGQEISSGSKFVLKPGDIVRLGRGLGNEVVLDYLGVSRRIGHTPARHIIPLRRNNYAIFFDNLWNQSLDLPSSSEPATAAVAAVGVDLLDMGEEAG
eukprot:symbB.v1.2.028311.t1/scaffold2990.1/size65776/3